jgi:hypothetical protein
LWGKYIRSPWRYQVFLPQNSDPSGSIFSKAAVHPNADESYPASARLRKYSNGRGNANIITVDMYYIVLLYNMYYNIKVLQYYIICIIILYYILISCGATLEHSFKVFHYLG